MILSCTKRGVHNVRWLGGMNRGENIGGAIVRKERDIPEPYSALEHSAIRKKAVVIYDILEWGFVLDPWAIAWPPQRKMARTGRNSDSIQDRRAQSAFRSTLLPMKTPTRFCWIRSSFCSINHSGILERKRTKMKIMID